MTASRPTHFEPIVGDYKVDADGCWIWQRTLDGAGYGQCRRGGGTSRAHRKYYRYFVGPIPEGAAIHHKCHTRACVNPDHLEPQSIIDHGRGHAWTRLGISREQYDRVRELGKDATIRYVDIVVATGLSQATVKRILTGRIATDIVGEPVRPEVDCEQCGERITSGHRHKRFCSRACRELFNKLKRNAERRSRQLGLTS